MTTMNCIVIDDEPVAIDILTDYIERVDFLELSGAFRNSLKALHFLKSHRVDLLFLDINMPYLSGIQFLDALDFHPLVVFTTAYSEYAAKSYDYEAVDYLLKPIEFERFFKAAGRALKRFDDRHSMKDRTASKRRDMDDGSILIKSGNDIHRIDTKDILYIKGTGNYITFVTGKKEIMALIKMKDVLSQLPKNRFFRIHRSYIVAFHHIDVIEKERVKIKNVSIPIGDAYKESFLRKINSV